jgi:hypothetical protein
MLPQQEGLPSEYASVKCVLYDMLILGCCADICRGDCIKVCVAEEDASMLVARPFQEHTSTSLTSQ